LSAVRAANSWIESPAALCIQGDIHKMPFKDNFFQKLFSQDGDAWLHPAKRSLMAEIYRVTAPNGMFVYQSYVDSRKMPKAVFLKTKALFKKCGFPHTAVVHIEDLTGMFETAGFRVESIRSLHNVYASDNQRMLNNLKSHWPKLRKKHLARHLKTLLHLLEWEQMLFSNRWWTGVLVIAKKT
jgi:cyclopropane fatty-acyl-phospholipid synthase-like methyltransferase